MKHEIIEAIEQGKPFAFGGHKLIAIPYDNTLDDVCDNCEMNRLCQGEISKLCDEINDQFLDCMYLAIIPQ